MGASPTGSDDGSPAPEEHWRGRFEDDLRQRLRHVYGGRRWLVATEIDQGSVALATRLRAVADLSVLAVGVRSGVGPIDPSIPLVSIDLPSTGELMADMHSGAEVLRNPPSAVRDAVERWDPEGRARAIGGLTAATGERVGRPTFGARPQQWADLEDKLAVEALWPAAGVWSAPSELVDVADAEALLDAHRRLATDQGTVWAGDNSSGFHGGAHGTFWVPDEAAVGATARRLDRYRRARVMPFVEGVPCSIHGMVLPDGSGGAGVAVFRPIEMMILRDPLEHRFVYGRAGSYWDPQPQDRRVMREAARRIGIEMHRGVGYRGVYTVDGVLGADGFVPTEVNPRYGGALDWRMDTVDGGLLDLMYLNMAVVEGVADGIDPELVDRWVTGNLDRRRRATAFLDIATAPPLERKAAVSRSGRGLLVVEELDPADPAGRDRGQDGDRWGARLAEIRWGSARGGGMLMIELGPRIERGPSTAPLLVEIIEAVDRHWHLGVRPLVPCRPVR